MKRQISKLAAVVGLCLMLGAASAVAQPAQPCQWEGQIGHTLEPDGWHVWQCEAGSWQYLGYCGQYICIV
ncbi:hypothetical protein QFW77_11230 [Luteimonas sp. RD2P54]|uniref:Uncharacterized protein n=1 Tax=Luteimonas endophytica TaxID=3042023 RepID=A0ABT6JBJ3_9GAMM|nr:hypothetical protein [Luteimonas endophytica]MDH5823558.1 hypothetical protein [Luteimonas endophytica]